jgi:hypothetical protein
MDADPALKYTFGKKWLHVKGVVSWHTGLLQNPLFALNLIPADRLCGLVVRVPGYRSRGPGSILGTTRFSEK